MDNDALALAPYWLSSIEVRLISLDFLLRCVMRPSRLLSLLCAHLSTAFVYHCLGSRYLLPVWLLQFVGQILINQKL